MDPVFFGQQLGTLQVALNIAGVSAGVSTVTGSQPVPYDGAFHHVAFTYDGNDIKLYLDAVPIGTRSASGTMTTGTTGNVGAYVGHRVSTSLDSQADIDEVELFSRALAADEAAGV